MNRLAFVLLLALGFSVHLEGQADALLQKAQQVPDTSIVLELHRLGAEYYKNGKQDSAYQLMLWGDSLSEILDYTNGKIKVWRGLGSFAARKGDFDESFQWLEKGLKLIEEKNLPVINRVDYLINLGVTYYYKGEIAHALDTYIEATQICRENGFDDKRAMLLNNTGIFMRMLERYAEAIDIYEESYSLREKMKDTMGMANNLFNMTAAYSYMGQHDKALEYSSKAKDIYVALNSETDILLTELSRGSALIELGRFEEALSVLKTLENRELPFDPDHLFLYHLSIAKLYNNNNDIRGTERHLNTIEDDLMASEMTDYKIDFLRLKASMLQNKGSTREAYTYLENYIRASEEKTDVQNKALLKEMETKYLTQEKDYEIAMLNSRNTLIKQRNRGLSAGIVLLGLMLAGLYYFVRKIQAQKAMISKANDEKEILLKEIHHRVKNNLQVISALLELQSKYIQDEAAQDAIRMGHDRVESMALIHKDLYQHDNLKGVNARDYLEKLIENLFQSYKIQEGDIVLHMDIEPIWLDVDTMIPLGLMINELLSNALKHAFIDQEKGQLFVSLKERENILELIVRDNGKGLPEGQHLETQSFGYSLVQSFARKLDADIAFENSGGLAFTLKIREYQKVA